MSKSATDRIKLMLSTGEYADVHFLVGDGDEKELVPAHKLILEKASDVFEAMFRFDAKNAMVENASANCCPVVEVPDVEASAFKVMLSFIYADDLSGLNGDNAMAVLYAAKKYNIPGLVDPCMDVPISNLRNVFFAYAQTRLFDLEGYVQRCLYYIEKNADDLLKSEEFLQIDQKLLSEILARDRLQINGEISIWKAVTENRRQMLGPALFKIRFPLVQKMEFSEKIVPFGILTAEEMTSIEQCHSKMNFHGMSDGIKKYVPSRNLTVEEVFGIEQYHSPPKFCGISDGILYPLRFPCHGRIPTHGTIVMDIEKFSEFAGEAVGNRRYSKTVQIMGFEWRIMAQKRINIKNTQKFLAFHLWYIAPKEDSNLCCVCSATFRIVSQKKGVNNNLDNSTGTLCDRIINNKKSWLGFNNFITIAELVNPKYGFYNRTGDKVTLAINLTEKDKKIEKFISDPCQSNGTISMEIEKVSEFAREVIGSERKSETVHVKRFPLRIWAQINPKNESNYNEKCLGIYLLCDAEKNEKCKYKYSATIRIISQKCDVADIRRELDAHILNNENNGWGLHNLITFEELLDPSKGFYDQSGDKVKLAIDVTVMT
ncbi:hypothetical protein niasHT_002871 [Heterodera trifolii]|uniref:BTB domain-containing protein n=1 Tax=Heterodera trifolii TaxID=157864 RepID=A0ABD2LSM7_9BILA